MAIEATTRCFGFIPIKREELPVSSTPIVLSEYGTLSGNRYNKMPDHNTKSRFPLQELRVASPEEVILFTYALNGSLISGENFIQRDINREKLRKIHDPFGGIILQTEYQYRRPKK